jgi:hypothetical protein
VVSVQFKEVFLPSDPWVPSSPPPTNQGVALSDNQNSLRALADTQLGLVTLASKADFDTFIETAKKQRIWHRERLARPPR